MWTRTVMEVDVDPVWKTVEYNACVFVHRYATEVDVDFVRKAVRAIGRCAIKVEQSSERCVSTLLDLIQTKVRSTSTAEERRKLMISA